MYTFLSFLKSYLLSFLHTWLCFLSYHQQVEHGSNRHRQNQQCQEWKESGNQKEEKCIKNTDTDETESIQSVKVKGYQSWYFLVCEYFRGFVELII